MFNILIVIAMAKLNLIMSEAFIKIKLYIKLAIKYMFKYIYSYKCTFIIKLFVMLTGKNIDLINFLFYYISNNYIYNKNIVIY